MPFVATSKLESRQIIPGYRARFIHSKNLTIAFWTIKKNYLLPEHAHPHEQVAMVTEGIFELIVAGEKKRLKPGLVCIIPGNTKHSGKAITDCKITDVFYPIREDYRKK